VELEMVFPSEEHLSEFLRDPRLLAQTSGNQEKAAHRPRVLLKRDGSLPEERSVEVVFHPAHLVRLDGTVRTVSRIAEEAGALPHHTAAGMHVHVSRPALRSLGAQGAVLVVWNLLPETVLRSVAGRGDCRYSKVQPQALRAPFAALLDNPEHYYRVDATRKSTLEVRVFRGDIDATVVLARASLVEGVAAYCREHPLNRKTAQTWRETYSHEAVGEWLTSHGEYAEGAKLLSAA
jgi:hypothetical protein